VSYPGWVGVACEAFHAQGAPRLYRHREKSIGDSQYLILVYREPLGALILSLLVDGTDLLCKPELADASGVDQARFMFWVPLRAEVVLLVVYNRHRHL
jgi:hypothetical protein